ncbi:MAG: leucine--tRNA ligase, partial [Simkaniaceae bacterium]|nr:leucine--tRNA ligase [Simkaniaceae bacterium]
MHNYDHKVIEKKWQKIWKERGLFKADIDTSKPKYYILDMFPYPSGAGLHVGHVTGYTATDILARYKRQKGFNVLHPMGWDSFGLPAEQYAVRTGTHPRITTEKNVNTYRKQLESIGFSYDWTREIMTSDPKYYKWTQWLFTKLYEKGLAYEAEINVNYCKELGTVLANEEVEAGRSKEGGFPVEKRPLRQWVLKITSYAESLLDGLEALDWPDYLKRLQRNWIGRSEGAKITFMEKEGSRPIVIFTTRPDTLFGATYLVLSPEHSLISKITTEQQKQEVIAYQKFAAAKSDLERTDLNKEKTGAFTGAYAINPVNQKLLPIWISDYVLMSYGTGAIMAVPGGDERDFAFAKEFNLPINPTYNPDLDKHGDSIPEGISRGEFRLEIVDGKRCWTKGGKCINSESPLLNINDLETQDAKKAVIEWLLQTGNGEKYITYKLRDWLFSRQRYWGEPFPILHFEDGSKRVLELDELPLIPPQISDFHPTGDGKSPLSKVKEWVEIEDPKTGKKALRETNTMPQWAGSCWYYLRFCDPHNALEAWSAEAEKYWMPVDMYVGGVEHATLHLLYARFWHKVLYDLGLVSTEEPFKTLRNQGLVTAKSYKIPNGGYVLPDEVKRDGDKLYDPKGKKELEVLVEKMSKSKLNGVSPDEMVEEYGSDSLRLYEMFMAPFDKEKLWNTDAAAGCYRFLCRFYDLVTSEKVSEDSSNHALKLGAKLVAGVEKDIEAMQFNTAIAKMMEFINAFSALPSYPKEVLIMATKALYPFAPHIAEECFEKLTGIS